MIWLPSVIDGSIMLLGGSIFKISIAERYKLLSMMLLNYWMGLWL